MKQLRRHHNKRIKAKRKNYWYKGNKTPRHIGMLLKTPKPCSCAMCCGRRRTEGKTIKELSMNEVFQHEMLIF